MSVSLRELYERARDYRLKLVAGKGALDAPVSWIHMVESTEIADFLEGGEIVFTTGIGIVSDEGLLDLVRALAEHDVSGVVLNTGPYIEKVPKAVADFCDSVPLALFSVPWDVHMVQIMRLFAQEITRSDQGDMELAAALRNAIACPDQEEYYLAQMERNGFSRDWRYCVAVLSVRADPPSGAGARRTGAAPAGSAGSAALAPKVSDERLEEIRRVVEASVTFHHWRVATLVYDHRLALVFARSEEDQVKQQASELLKVVCGNLGAGEHVFTGVGKITRSARCIGKSHIQALRLERLQRLRGNEATLSFYDEAGIMKLLLAIDDREMLESYRDDTVGVLILHDQLNGSDYVRVLDCYLKHSGSIRDAAEDLYVHRNTVNYKIRRIEEMLGCNLSDFATRERMDIGLRAEEVLHTL